MQYTFSNSEQILDSTIVEIEMPDKYIGAITTQVFVTNFTYMTITIYGVGKNGIKFQIAEYNADTYSVIPTISFIKSTDKRVSKLIFDIEFDSNFGTQKLQRSIDKISITI